MPAFSPALNHSVPSALGTLLAFALCLSQPNTMPTMAAAHPPLTSLCAAVGKDLWERNVLWLGLLSGWLLLGPNTTRFTSRVIHVYWFRGRCHLQQLLGPLSEAAFQHHLWFSHLFLTWFNPLHLLVLPTGSCSPGMNMAVEEMVVFLTVGSCPWW